MLTKLPVDHGPDAIIKGIQIWAAWRQLKDVETEFGFLNNRICSFVVCWVIVELSLGIFRLGAFAWELELGTFRLGRFAWELSVESESSVGSPGQL